MWKLCDPLSLVSKLNCQAAPELHSLARPFSLLYPMPLNYKLLGSGCQSPAPPCPGWALTSSGSFASLGFFSLWRPPVLTLSPENDALWAPGASSPRALSPPECGPANWLPGRLLAWGRPLRSAVPALGPGVSPGRSRATAELHFPRSTGPFCMSGVLSAAFYMYLSLL